jgi:hypothetical protein
MEKTYVQARIYGQFPSVDADDAGISWDLVRTAMDRELEVDAAAAARSQDPEHIQLGVDCARFGPDEFSIAVRVGPEIKPLRTWPKTSGVDMVQKVIETVEMSSTKQRWAEAGLSTLLSRRGASEMSTASTTT